MNIRKLLRVDASVTLVLLAGCVSAASAQSQSTSTLLPVRDGRYALASDPCDTAPMSVRDVIVHGQPIYSPQSGECKTQIVKRAKGVYVVNSHCTQGDHFVTTYKILSRTRFISQNESGQEMQMRWCSGL